MQTLHDNVISNPYIECAFMDIAKLVVQYGKAGDLINFSGEGVYIRSSDHESIYRYMHAASELPDYTFDYVRSREKEYGLRLKYRLTHIQLPMAIMKVKRVYESFVFKNVKFDALFVDDDLNLSQSDFFASFAKEIFE